MKVELKRELFKSDKLTQDLILDGLDFFVKKFKEVGGRIDAIYPGDPFALPFSMYLSNKLSVPIKTEQFLKKEDKVLLLFSLDYKNLITGNYIVKKIEVFRERFPNSPSLLVASSLLNQISDVQLISYSEFSEIFTYRFRKEALNNYFYPVKGEITHFSELFWKLAKEEIKVFEKARRIRENARRYLRENLPSLKPLEEDPELLLWEKFVKFSLLKPFLLREEKVNLKIKLEKLIQVEDRRVNSAVTSLLEYVSQVLETHFPTYLAYSNLEVVERKGITIVPKVSETMEGVDFKFEVVLVSEKNLEREFIKLINLLKDSLKAAFKEIFGGEAFRPIVDYVVEKEVGKGIAYVSWFLDREMVEKVLKKINKRWLLSRLLYRKRFKSQMTEFLKFLEDFTFTPENFDKFTLLLESLWKQNPSYCKLYGKEIKSRLDQKELWPLVGYYGIKTFNAKSSLISSLVSFLLSLKGYENVHHLLSEEKTYFIPVKTKRVLRGDWERVAKEGRKLLLKQEPLNPESPVTYTVVDEEGNLLGTIPEVFAHYLFAWKEKGGEITCEKLYIDTELFSENSYWIKVKCL